MGKSGREIWISVFAMIIPCPELVKIKRGNKIKEVRSGVLGTPTGMVGVCSGLDVLTTGTLRARRRADGMAGGTVRAASGVIGKAENTSRRREERVCVERVKMRAEERRGGKERRCRCVVDQENKTRNYVRVCT